MSIVAISRAPMKLPNRIKNMPCKIHLKLSVKSTNPARTTRKACRRFTPLKIASRLSMVTGIAIRSGVSGEETLCRSLSTSKKPLDVVDHTQMLCLEEGWLAQFEIESDQTKFMTPSLGLAIVLGMRTCFR